MDDFENMEANLREAMKRTKKDLKLTSEEEDRLTKAFKEPEFKKLMSDYMQEISDPKNKAEYDAYIQQLEADNKVPKGTKLVRPDAGFCVKCRKQGTGEKVFVNICSAPDAGIATSKSTSKGQNWQIPHMMGPPHMEQDKSKTPCMTFDICFHPDTLKRASKNVRFQQLIVQTALETIQEKTTKYGQVVKLESNFRILKGVKAIGGKPNMLSVKIDTPSSEVSSIQKDQEKATKAKSSKKKSSSTSTDKGSASKPFSSAKPKADDDSLSCIVVERGHFDMSNFISGDSRSKVNRHRPQELVVKINMAGVKSMSNVELDVSERELVLTVPGKPRLVKRLPYPVDGDAGKAKFHRKTSTLQVVVPVLPPAAEEAEIEEVKEEPKHDKKDGEESQGSLNAGMISTVSSSDTPSQLADTYAKERNTVHHVNGEMSKESKEESRAPSSIVEEASSLLPPETATATATASSGKEGGEDVTENAPKAPVREVSIPAGLDPEMMEKIRQAREAYSNWAKKGDIRDEEEAARKAQEEAEATEKVLTDSTAADSKEPVLDSDSPSFIACSKFSGARKGYVFQKGSKGLGYYIDPRTQRKTVSHEMAATGTSVSTNAKKRDNVTPESEKTSDEKSNTDAVDENEQLVDLPPHRFRQDMRTLTLLIQVKCIDENAVYVEFSPSTVVVAFKTADKQFGLRLTAPKDCTLLSTQSRYNVSDRNLAVIIAKEQAQKWGAEMKIEPIAMSEFQDVVSETFSKIKEEPVDDADASTPSHDFGSDDGVHGGSSMLSNTLMYDLS